MSAVGTIISSISLLLQLYDKYGEKEAKKQPEYKKSLRYLVSTLYFSKMMHGIAHTIIDLDSTRWLEKDARDITISSIQKDFNSSLGDILRCKMNLEINPNLPRFKSLVMGKTKLYNIDGLSNNFVNAVETINAVYPKMIKTYEELYHAVYTIHQDLIDLSSDDGFEFAILKNYSRNKVRWKHYIDIKNKDLLTYANQSILHKITILDTLFII